MRKNQAVAAKVGYGNITGMVVFIINFGHYV